VLQCSPGANVCAHNLDESPTEIIFHDVSPGLETELMSNIYYFVRKSVIMKYLMNNLATILIPLLILHTNLSIALAAIGKENLALVPLEKQGKIWEDIPKPKERIVGGETAVAGAYPFFAQWMTGCGGSLIHDDIVLTAGTYGICFLVVIPRSLFSFVLRLSHDSLPFSPQLYIQAIV
jgi:hypothetical protein